MQYTDDRKEWRNDSVSPCTTHRLESILNKELLDSYRGLQVLARGAHKMLQRKPNKQQQCHARRHLSDNPHPLFTCAIAITLPFSIASRRPVRLIASVRINGNTATLGGHACADTQITGRYSRPRSQTRSQARHQHLIRTSHGVYWYDVQMQPLHQRTCASFQ